MADSTMKTRTCTLCGLGTLRNFFEKDQEFPESAAWLLDAYESATEQAMRSARRAIQDYSTESREKAVWDEAVCQTIERALSALLPGGGEMELPKR